MSGQKLSIPTVSVTKIYHKIINCIDNIARNDNPNPTPPNVYYFFRK
jgi:hypothetical protein